MMLNHRIAITIELQSNSFFPFNTIMVNTYNLFSFAMSLQLYTKEKGMRNLSSQK